MASWGTETVVLSSLQVLAIECLLHNIYDVNISSIANRSRRLSDPKGDAALTPPTLRKSHELLLPGRIRRLPGHTDFRSARELAEEKRFRTLTL